MTKIETLINDEYFLCKRLINSEGNIEYSFEMHKNIKAWGIS